MRQIDKVMYTYIIEVEMEIFRHYKVMMFENEKYMTMIDLQGFVQKLNAENKKDEEERNKGGNNWIKSLFAIGDIINFMRYKDTSQR